jgi:hypothetical protein
MVMVLLSLGMAIVKDVAFVRSICVELVVEFALIVVVVVPTVTVIALGQLL